MQISNPCKRCLVRPMCKKECELYNKWIEHAANFVMGISGVIITTWFINMIIISILIGYPEMFVLLFFVTFTVSYIIYKFTNSAFMKEVFGVEDALLTYFCAVYAIVLIFFVHTLEPYMKPR